MLLRGTSLALSLHSMGRQIEPIKLLQDRYKNKI